MQRVGYYLRGRERALWPSRTTDEVKAAFVEDPDAYPLLWENYIGPNGPERRVRKQLAPYLGAVLIYGDVYVASFAAFLMTVWAHEFGGHDSAWRMGSVVYMVVVTIACALLLRNRYRIVKALRNGSAGSASESPQEGYPP
jgi:hypothetical protein